MKRKLLLMAGLLVTGFAAISQDKVNLVIFSEDGDAFYAFINGVRQNDKYETNVRVTGLSPNISLRIEFENKALPQLKQNMPLEAGYEHTVKIRRDMKKQVKLTYFGQTPINNAPVQGVTDVAYHQDPTSSSGNYNTTTGNGYTNSSSSSTTVTSTPGTTDQVNVNMNVNGMGGAGISMNMNTSVPADNITTTSSTTVTSSSSSSGYQQQTNNNTMNTQGNGYGTQAATGGGCNMAMSPSSFATMKQSVEAKPFSDTKMSTAKVATKNNCISTAQVKEICKLFSMDEDKLAYAKYAYDYCVDKTNYYSVSEVFSFSSTTDDFNKFLGQ